MNSAALAVVSLLCFAGGYKFYSKKLRKVWNISPDNPTPAHTLYNGVDFVPSKNWLFLFGHHFASIAGAGPILGPVIACAIWGWLPAVVWVVAGSIFIGGVHDFSALILSVRNGGSSIADISEKVIGRNAKIFFSVFILLALILVIAVFAIVTAQTLLETPQIVIPTLGLIVVAIFVGLMLYKWNVNSVAATLIGLAALAGLIFLGEKYPVGLNCANAATVWIIGLLIYAGVASVLPVNILLQPRDYLSSFLLFAGLILGFLGVIISHPQFQTPAVITFASASGMLWPSMCIIIACGANSGFHSLVASGTTSKQLSSEKYAFRIGYGAMIMEGVMAILAIIAVSAGLPWKGYNSYPALMKSGNWIRTFALGFGSISKPLLGRFGPFFAMLMLNAFVMTTLDTATRITRYVGQELLGNTFKIKIFKNGVVMTLVIIAFAFYLAGGPRARLWPIFGASNQLIAALVLIVVAAYLFSRKLPSLFVIIPGAFMLVTTVIALIIEMVKNYGENNLLFVISVILLALAVFVVVEASKKIKTREVYRNG
ncbi:MAG: carbon starvation protein A [bacterium]